MEVEAIMQTLREFVQQKFEIPENDLEFTDDVHLFDYGYVDSFGAQALISFVESTFSIHIKQSDLVAYPLNTIREIAEFAIKRHGGEL